MSTISDVREAMRTFEPGWSLDVGRVRAAAVHARRRRSRMTLSIGVITAFAVLAGAGTVYAAQPWDPARRSQVMGGSAPRADTTAPQPPPTPVPSPSPSIEHPSRGTRPATPPDSLSLAALPTEPTPRTGTLPPVEQAGPPIPIGWADVTVQLQPGPGGAVLCARTADCSPLTRRSGGWLRVDGLRGHQHDDAPVIAVIDAPLTRAVAAAGSSEVPATILDLGSGYRAVVAVVPTDGSGAVLPGVRLWGFDDYDRLVAYGGT